MDDHEKAEEDNVDGDDHDDISTRLFVLRIVRIKTSRIKMKRTGMTIMTISTGSLVLQMIMKKTARIKMKRTMMMMTYPSGCLSYGWWR